MVAGPIGKTPQQQIQITLGLAMDLLLAAQQLMTAYIEMLDVREGDTDMEDGGDAEMSLGASNPPLDPSDPFWSPGSGDDREGEHDGTEPEAEV
jgi:hypothetical protein